MTSPSPVNEKPRNGDSDGSWFWWIVALGIVGLGVWSFFEKPKRSGPVTPQMMDQELDDQRRWGGARPYGSLRQPKGRHISSNAG
jgi:hypothetical protein